MNSTTKTILMLGAIALTAFGLAVAQEPTGQGAPEGMPPMGPPEEMKQIANLVGVWDYEMMMKMDMLMIMMAGMRMHTRETFRLIIMESTLMELLELWAIME